MNRRLYSIAGLILIAPHPYSCHKTTAQESYADSRRCFAALDANAGQLSPKQFRAAGINGESVEFAARQMISAAFDSGEAIGMKPAAIYADLHKASADYREAHMWTPPGQTRRKFTALGYDLNDCLADFYGRPND